MRTPAKGVYPQGYRGFESLLLRQDKKFGEPQRGLPNLLTSSEISRDESPGFNSEAHGNHNLLFNEVIPPSPPVQALIGHSDLLP